MHTAVRYGAKDMVNAFCHSFNFHPHEDKLQKSRQAARLRNNAEDACLFPVPVLSGLFRAKCKTWQNAARLKAQTQPTTKLQPH